MRAMQNNELHGLQHKTCQNGFVICQSLSFPFCRPPKTSSRSGRPSLAFPAGVELALAESSPPCSFSFNSCVIIALTSSNSFCIFALRSSYALSVPADGDEDASASVGGAASEFFFADEERGAAFSCLLLKTGEQYWDDDICWCGVEVAPGTGNIEGDTACLSDTGRNSTSSSRTKPEGTRRKGSPAADRTRSTATSETPRATERSGAGDEERGAEAIEGGKG